MDVAIEFSHADAVLENARAYVRLGLSAVVGTTGWYGKLDELKRHHEGRQDRATCTAATSPSGRISSLPLLPRQRSFPTRFPNTTSWDGKCTTRERRTPRPARPSRIARIITTKHPRKKKVVTERLDRAPAPDELHFASVRGGEVPGIHTVLLDSLFDTIELTHSARSRGGLALGAVRAAEWLQGKKGLFEVSDFIQDALGRKEP